MHLAASVRVTTAPLTLSTGHTLPRGTRYGFAAYALQNSPLAPFLSSSSTPPSQFDGNRYYNLRKGGQENKYQFVTTSAESLNFGHGNHACPGRFFASNEIKVVLIHLLRGWELRFKGDEGGRGGEGMRPGNFWMGTICTPNSMAEVEVRRKPLVKV